MKKILSSISDCFNSVTRLSVFNGLSWLIVLAFFILSFIISRIADEESLVYLISNLTLSISSLCFVLFITILGIWVTMYSIAAWKWNNSLSEDEEGKLIRFDPLDFIVPLIGIVAANFLSVGIYALYNGYVMGSVIIDWKRIIISTIIYILLGIFFSFYSEKKIINR